MSGIIAGVTSFLMRGGATRGIDPSSIFNFHAPCTDLKGRFRFEWHTKSQRLYVVDIAQGEKTKRVVANVMAFNIETEGGAYNAALCWCRGWLASEQGRSHNDQGKIVLLGEHS